MAPPWFLRSLLALVIGASAQLCYKPDGTLQDARYAPCTAGHFSMCCRTNTTLSPDTCRPDGLCQSSIVRSWVWRESCTDREWKAPECLQLCVGERGVFLIFYMYSKSWRLTDARVL